MANTTTELTWMSFILKDLQIPLASTLTLYCDNISALHMTINLVFYARSKHIELDYHFMHERVALGHLITHHISTTEQIADLFTKPMSKAALSHFRTKLCLRPQHSLRDGICITQHVVTSHNSCYSSGETLKDDWCINGNNPTYYGSSTS